MLRVETFLVGLSYRTKESSDRGKIALFPLFVTAIKRNSDYQVNRQTFEQRGTLPESVYNSIVLDNE